MITKTFSLSLESPVGPLRISGTARGICAVTFAESLAASDGDIPASLHECLQQIEEYFAGGRRAFALPIVMRATDFQQSVWDALLRIPFGRTATYGDIAEQVGHPGAARAVGNAVHDNPLAIIVPCHRILPASGGVGEYASGSHRKEWLLKHEGVL